LYKTQHVGYAGDFRAVFRLRGALGIVRWAALTLFNVNQPITTPLVFALIALASGFGRKSTGLCPESLDDRETI